MHIPSIRPSAVMTLALIDVNAGELTTSQMEQIVREVTDAQNRATRRGATLADVERLYAMYTDDFVYEHPGMNDT